MTIVGERHQQNQIHLSSSVKHWTEVHRPTDVTEGCRSVQCCAASVTPVTVLLHAILSDTAQYHLKSLYLLCSAFYAGCMGLETSV
jgi:hypothetical protein